MSCWEQDEPCEPRYFMKNDIYQISGISVLWQLYFFPVFAAIYISSIWNMIDIVVEQNWDISTEEHSFTNKYTKYSNNSVSAQFIRNYFPAQFCDLKIHFRTKLRNSQTNLRENPSHEGYQSWFKKQFSKLVFL